MAIPEAGAGLEGGDVETTGEGQTEVEHAQVAEAELVNPARTEIVMVGHEDLQAYDTASTVKVSAMDSHDNSLDAEKSTNKPGTESIESMYCQTAAPSKDQAQPYPAMAITKVQPFLGDDPGAENTLRGRLLARRMDLVISAGVLLAITVVLTGLGVGLRCMGKFRCGTSGCISSSARCDGHVDCEQGEDELNCVRVSGKSSVLQVLTEGIWRTVCSDYWDADLGLSACRQLGYSSYVESGSTLLSTIEQELKNNFVSMNRSTLYAIKIHNATDLSKTECSSGKVITLKCLECGSRPLFSAQFSARIVGGNLSREGQFPWQLWMVLVGRTEQPVSEAKYLAVEKIVYHSRYRPQGLDHDIALMKLAKPLTFNGYVEPICLPNFGEEFEDGMLCWISGWGATTDGGEVSTSLHSAQVPLISAKACSQPDVYQGYISPGMICAGYLEGGTDSCQGDSGGPLACEDASLWKLVGATSWGLGCAERNKPGVYTRITRALTWIHQQMEREETLNPSFVSLNSSDTRGLEKLMQ